MPLELLQFAEKPGPPLVLLRELLPELFSCRVGDPAELFLGVVHGDLPDVREQLRKALQAQPRLVGDGRQRDAKQAAQGALAARHEVHGEHLCLRVAAELLAGAADPECPSDRCVGSHDSFSRASIPRFKIAISTARQHRSGLSPRLAAQRETASRSRCSSSTGTRIAVRHGESAGMTDTGALTLSPPCARVSTYVGLYLLIVGSSLSVEVGHEVRALQRRGPHFVLCDDCTTPAGCPAMGRWGRCKVAIHAWRSPVNTPTSTNPCRGGAGSHHADNFTDRGLSSTMKPSPFLPTRRRSTGFFVQPESWSGSTLENRQQRMCGRPGRGLARRPPACCHMHR